MYHEHADQMRTNKSKYDITGAANKRLPDRNPEFPFIRELCAHLSEEEIQEANESFWRYTEIVRGIFDRQERDRKFAQDAAEIRPDEVDEEASNHSGEFS